MQRGRAIKVCWWPGVRANSNPRNAFSAKQNLSHKNSGLLSHNQAETNCQLIQKFLRKVFCLKFDSFRCYQLRKDWSQVNYSVQIANKTSLYWYAVHEASWPLQSCCYGLSRSGSRIFRIDLHILETEAWGQHQRGAALPLREQEEPCWALQPAGKFHINNAEYPQAVQFSPSPVPIHKNNQCNRHIFVSPKFNLQCIVLQSRWEECHSVNLSSGWGHYCSAIPLFIQRIIKMSTCHQ